MKQPYGGVVHEDLGVHYADLGYLQSMTCCLKLFDVGLHAIGKCVPGNLESLGHFQGWVVQTLPLLFALRSGRGSGCTGDL